MAREADLLLPTYAGPEIGVASTKAFTSYRPINLARRPHIRASDEKRARRRMPTRSPDPI
jgi:glucosamine 6-phosphate synthetase-like amidotransferase/phosphosugar isomerase protein